MGDCYIRVFYRDKVIIRHLCSDVSGRGNQHHPATENVKKAYVFLNPTANNGDAKGKFQKFAAPILNLAEFEVILIEVSEITYACIFCILELYV